MDRYKEDTEIYMDIVNRYQNLAENDIVQAFKLMKDSLLVYDRWCFIKLEITSELKRGEKEALKKWLEERCKFLYELHTDVRVTLSKAKYEFNNSKDF
ncbi:hypothetical protein H8S10_04545 [Clostridium sp. NSJ-49]|uniref:hypothetical protein n=1 Tax=Clostridium TaxID=1485 RepID=UPI00164B32F1|nr:hypothetical protein [Clostridium sp. NSJ-49]MBC5624723.1 hypothetical protein [Clostridium sp. NSJ-49]